MRNFIGPQNSNESYQMEIPSNQICKPISNDTEPALATQNKATNP